MYHAIATRFIGPTNFKGSRVKAFTPSGESVTLGWDSAISPEENHRRAAAACFRKFLLWEEGKGVDVQASYSVFGIPGQVILCRSIEATKALY
jgi:hypothetical protein